MIFFKTFILLIFGQALLAQKLDGFFFEPLANVKTTVFSKKELQPEITTPYFKIKPQNFITPFGFNIGLNLGYKFKNNNIIQVGFFQDGSSSGVDFTGNIIVPPNNYPTYNGIIANKRGGVTVTNFNVLFKKEIFHIITNKKEKEPYVAVYFNLGLTYFYKPNNGLENLTGTNQTSFYSTDSAYVQYTKGIWVLPQRPINSFKINLGLEITFGKKNRELFNLGIYYISNLQKSSYFSFSSSDVKVTDKHGNISVYTYYVKARGNGLYYQISKRFYPFKWYNNRQNKKLEEYKIRQNN